MSKELENQKLNYVTQGDYCLPCIRTKEQTELHIGVWAIKNEKIYSTEHQHLLTGIIKCPICGAGLYGSVNRKRKKDGSFYRDYWYYACKHRLEYDGHKCTFKKQIHQEKINEAVVEVIRNIVKNSKFDSAIKEKLDASVDLSKYEK